MTEGIFGSIIFGKLQGRIMTFEDISRKYTGRYGSHMVHLQKPLLEWAGNDLIEIRMKINLNAAWCGNPLPLLAEWHRFHEDALAAPLLVGQQPMAGGQSLFVITNMEESHKHWLVGGRLIAVELVLEFKEYIATANDTIFTYGTSGFVTGLLTTPIVTPPLLPTG